MGVQIFDLGQKRFGRSQLCDGVLQGGVLARPELACASPPDWQGWR